MIASYLFSLLIVASPAANTREISRLRDIEAAIDAGTLVIFDIDNTLIEPVQMLGSDQWFYALVDQIRTQEKLDQERAIDRAMGILNAVQADTEVPAVELSRHEPSTSRRSLLVSSERSGPTSRGRRSPPISSSSSPLPRS